MKRVLAALVFALLGFSTAYAGPAQNGQVTTDSNVAGHTIPAATWQFGGVRSLNAGCVAGGSFHTCPMSSSCVIPG